MITRNYHFVQVPLLQITHRAYGRLRISVIATFDVPFNYVLTIPLRSCSLIDLNAHSRISTVTPTPATESIATESVEHGLNTNSV